jgi:hypothetical protein
MRRTLTSPKERKSGKVEIGLVRLSLSKYSATEADPFKPLSPVSSVDDILPGEMLFAVASVRYHKRVRVLGGVLRVDRSRRIVPEGSEDQGVEICPPDLEENHTTLRKELLDDLEDNKEHIWNAIARALISSLGTRARSNQSKSERKEGSRRP